MRELNSAVKSLREDNARLEQRLARLEVQGAVSVAARKETTPPSATQVMAPPPTDASVPQLTVVKLKPKKEAAPKIATQVAIVEPSPDAIDALQKDLPDKETDDDDPAVGDAMFDKGVNALKTGNVNGGITELQSFAAASPRHPKADNALYFSGLGLMGLADYEKAARAFEEVLARYPAGDAVLDSMLKLAECRLKMNRPAEARSVYQRIVSTYPGTAAASAAQTRLTSLR